MARPTPMSLAAHFARLPDPRVRRTRRHELTSILVITVCAVICGADDWVAIARFGRAKRPWFRQFLPLPHGIPSHDTFGRVFAALDPQAFHAAFLAWVQSVATLLPGDVIAIDGKTLRRTFDTASQKAAIHMVSAWATAHGLCLGQVKTDAKSNEITAIPALLDVLALTGRIVSIDAIGCQPAIARRIRDRGGDYVLSLKANQGRLHEDIQALFADAAARRFQRHRAVLGAVAVWSVLAPTSARRWIGRLGWWVPLGLEAVRLGRWAADGRRDRHPPGPELD